MSTITEHANPGLTGYLNSTDANKSVKLAAILKELIDLRRKSEIKETEFKVELKDTLKPAYFKYNEDAEKATDVTHAFDIGDLQVNFTNSYFIRGSQHYQQLIKLLGEDHPLTQTLKESQKITVDVTSLSESDAKALARDIAKATVDYKAPIPKVERCAIATKDFHDLRHVYLTTEDNLALDAEIPIVIQVTPIGLN